MKRMGFILFLIPLLCGCQIMQAIQATPRPLVESTVELQLDQVPQMPTLPPLRPTPTLSVLSQVNYEANVNLFTRVTRESVPVKILQKTTLFGTVRAVDDQTGEFKLAHASGVEFSVTCDDYCFFVDSQKRLLSSKSLGVGSSVIVFGVSGKEDLTTINADAVAIDTLRRFPAKPEKTDLSKLPYYVKYKEYELTSAPQIDPFSIETEEKDKKDKPIDLNQKLKDRLKTSLSSRTDYTYGWYGENYFAYMEYEKENNRDPNYPTRANMQVVSNDYPFFDFWYPHIDNPMPNSWGIICWAGDWYLPIRMTVDVDADPTIVDLIYCDRTIRSQSNYDKNKDYLRSFGYSIFLDKFFYFYEKESGYGFSIDLIDIDLGFDEIPFGYVDTFSELDPFFADELITFFGRRDGKWYYVEISENTEYAY